MGGGLCFPWWQDLVPFFFTGISSMVKPVRLDQNARSYYPFKGYPFKCIILSVGCYKWSGFINMPPKRTSRVLVPL